MTNPLDRLLDRFLEFLRRGLAMPSQVGNKYNRALIACGDPKSLPHGQDSMLVRPRLQE